MTEKDFRDQLQGLVDNTPAETHCAFLSAAAPRKEEKVMKRKMSVAIIFAVLVSAVALALAAAEIIQTLPGVREMIGVSGQDTDKMLQPISYTWETPYNTAEAREMLYDGQGAYIAVDVKQKERDDILLLPMGRKTSLKSIASELGIIDAEKGETVAEYAERKGKMVVFFAMMAQSMDQSFTAIVDDDDLVSMEPGSWTIIIRFPAVKQDEQINLRLYTTEYNNPLAQSKLSIYSSERPSPEPHSIAVRVPDFQDISMDRTEVKATMITEDDRLSKGLAVQEANLIKTPIATYLDLKIENLENAEYGLISAYVIPLGIPESDLYRLNRKHYVSPLSIEDGYRFGARVIELFPADHFACDEFKIDLSISPMTSTDESSNTVQMVNAGSVTVLFR
ncbi:MAG: hypothetical protein IJ153_06410 [Clostridia bacterium]|nr:hypothetical protein [Clostridia bacterium]